MSLFPISSFQIASGCWQITGHLSSQRGRSPTTTGCGTATSTPAWPSSPQGRWTGERLTSVTCSFWMFLICFSWSHLLRCRHPFQGQYSVADVKLRLSQWVQFHVILLLFSFSSKNQGFVSSFNSSFTPSLVFCSSERVCCCPLVVVRRSQSCSSRGSKRVWGSCL